IHEEEIEKVSGISGNSDYSVLIKMTFTSLVLVNISAIEESNWTNCSDPLLWVQEETDTFLKEKLGPRRISYRYLAPLMVIYSVIFVAGLAGNILTCVVVAKQRNMRTSTNLYLLNLAVTDIITLALYGCQLWRLDDPKVDQLCTTWKVCCHKFLNLSPRTRSRFIHHLMGTVSILDIVMCRRLSFFKAGLNNEDNLIFNFFKSTLLANTLYIQVNIYKILECFNVTYHDMFFINKSKLKNILNNLKGEKNDNVTCLTNCLLSIIDGTVTTDLDLKYNEIKYMLNQV
ncbi:unnamed protein product, partial [Meganyctiphanes norvegica]